MIETIKKFLGMKHDEPHTPLDRRWNPSYLIRDILDLRQLAYEDNYRGPFRLEISELWIPNLKLPYSQYVPIFADPQLKEILKLTLGERILNIDQIKEIRVSCHLQDWEIALVSLNEGYRIKKEKK